MNDQNAEGEMWEPVDGAIVSFLATGDVDTPEDLLAMRNHEPEDLNQRIEQFLDRLSLTNKYDDEGLRNRARILNLATRKNVFWNQISIRSPKTTRVDLGEYFTKYS